MTEVDDTDDEVANNLKNEIGNFNVGLDEKTRDFILTMSFQKAAQNFLPSN